MKPDLIGCLLLVLYLADGTLIGLYHVRGKVAKSGRTSGIRGTSGYDKFIEKKDPLCQSLSGHGSEANMGGDDDELMLNVLRCHLTY